MPGTIVFKPIEAKLTHNTDLLTRMNPYCTVIVGHNKLKGRVCKKGGKHPFWNDVMTVPIGQESEALVKVMDKDKITHDDNVGSFMIDLQEVQRRGQISGWYPLYYKNKPAGELLMEVAFQPDGGCCDGGNVVYSERVYTSTSNDTTAGVGAGYSESTYEKTLYSNSGYQQEQQQEYCHSAQPGFAQTQQDIISNNTTTTTTHTHHTTDHPTLFTEQKQVVQPHTFLKEVEVVETRPTLQEVQVMEPVKVLKDVQVTQSVPVKKHIHLTQPEVVTKQVQVTEPRLVTKTIQVVEDVPVTREVEVVQMRDTVQEVETVEPRTYTEQVEVTEYVPTKKQVEVTEPVRVKKAVEYVEPVITTQRVTKEVQEPVIVNEEVTTCVGPASMVGVKTQCHEHAYGAADTHCHDSQRRAANDVEICDETYTHTEKVVDNLI